MASWQVAGSRALQAIPRVVDNTAELSIRQWLVTSSHVPVRLTDMPGGPGTFSPYGNINFLST